MILNKQNKQIQFTIEDEKWRKIFNFSWHKNKDNKVKHEFDVYRKPAVTNVQIKPHSWLTSSTITSIFKGFLARATKVCSEKYLKGEIEWDIFFWYGVKLISGQEIEYFMSDKFLTENPLYFTQNSANAIIFHMST